MTPDEFRSEMQAVPYVEPDPRYYKLAMEYHTRAEAFDQHVCSRRRGATAWPANGAELSAVTKNAKSLIREIVVREGFGREQENELREWIGRTDEEFYRGLRKA